MTQKTFTVGSKIIRALAIILGIEQPLIAPVKNGLLVEKKKKKNVFSLHLNVVRHCKDGNVRHVSTFFLDKFLGFL